MCSQVLHNNTTVIALANKVHAAAFARAKKTKTTNLILIQEWHQKLYVEQYITIFKYFTTQHTNAWWGPELDRWHKCFGRDSLNGRFPRPKLLTQSLTQTLIPPEANPYHTVVLNLNHCLANPNPNPTSSLEHI